MKDGMTLDLQLSHTRASLSSSPEQERTNIISVKQIFSMFLYKESEYDHRVGSQEIVTFDEYGGSLR